MASPATIVHDPSEAVPLCPALGLYLKPIARVSITVALPAPRPGAVSTWEVMERLKALVAGGGGGGAGPGGASGGGAGPGGPPPRGGRGATPRAQFSALRIARCTPDLVRFEGELENRALARACVARLDGQSIRLAGGGGGCADALRVRAHAELPRPGGGNNHDGGVDAPGGAEEAEDGGGPGERPDTLHLQGLPCRWFADRGAAAGTPDALGGGVTTALTAPGGGNSERPTEAALRQAFGAFGAIRRVDIPMLDPYRGEATAAAVPGVGVGGGSGGGAGQLPQFEAYVQYRDPAGVARALAALRGTRLMFRGEDGKAVACGIKVTSDATQHLSEAAVRRRQQERQKLQELERQREAQKRREKEAEARRRAEERRQQEAEAQARARRREEKLRRREQRASRRHRRRAEREAEREAQRRLRGRVRLEERRLLLAQRALQAVRLVAELLGRAKAARLRRLQEAELRRVEQEKERALGLQRRERELRRRLLALLLGRGDPAGAGGGGNTQGHAHPPADHDHDPGGRASALLRPMLDILHRVSRQAGSGRPLPGPGETPGDPAEAPDAPEGAEEQEPAAVTSSIAPVTSSPAPAAPPTEPGDPSGDPDPPSRRRRSNRDRDRKRGRRHHHQPHPHRGDREPSTCSRSRSPLPAPPPSRHRRSVLC